MDHFVLLTFLWSHFRKDKHKIFVKSAVTEILNLPLGAGMFSNLQSDLGKFQEKFFIPFLNALTAEVKEAFRQLDFWFTLGVFDPRLPKDQNLLSKSLWKRSHWSQEEDVPPVLRSYYWYSFCWLGKFQKNYLWM